MPVKNIIKHITLKFHNGSIKVFGKSRIKLMNPNHPTNCLTLDLVKIPNQSLKGLSRIGFCFNMSTKYQIEVRLEDRQFSLSRAFRYNKFGNLGPKMILTNSTRSSFKYYSVQFKQESFTENTPGKKCKMYGKTSYNDCDQQFIKKWLTGNYPQNFTPIWATSNSSAVSTHFINNNYFHETYKRLILGTMRSDCPPPCTTTDITSVLIDEKNDNFSESRIDITFSDQVSTIVNNFPQFSTAYFLSACGGSMGMWLGMGVVQIVEILTRMIWRVKINMKHV